MEGVRGSSARGTRNPNPRPSRFPPHFSIGWRACCRVRQKVARVRHAQNRVFFQKSCPLSLQNHVCFFGGWDGMHAVPKWPTTRKIGLAPHAPFSSPPDRRCSLWRARKRRLRDEFTFSEVGRVWGGVTWVLQPVPNAAVARPEPKKRVVGKM